MNPLVKGDGQLPEDDDLPEIDLLDRTEDNILHGYFPNPSYDPASMEDDGIYPQDLNWSYSNVVPGIPNTNYPHYNGEDPCLRRYVDRKFETLLGACGTVGGFSYELVKHITMNSNTYVWARLVGNKLYGSDWKNITVEEIFHTFGMILKMSLVIIRLGVLKDYFNPITKLYISGNQAAELQTVDTNWTDECLMYKRFLQIELLSILRKEFQRLATNAINSELQYSFSMSMQKKIILGREISFNEGGIVSKSCYNPVW